MRKKWKASAICTNEHLTNSKCHATDSTWYELPCHGDFLTRTYFNVWQSFLDGEYTLCVSNVIIEEYLEVLARNINRRVAEASYMQFWPVRTFANSLPTTISFDKGRWGRQQVRGLCHCRKCQVYSDGGSSFCGIKANRISLGCRYQLRCFFERARRHQEEVT